jgi:hypothetical protein
MKLPVTALALAAVFAGCGNDNKRADEPACVTVDKHGKSVATSPAGEICGAEAVAWCERTAEDREEFLTFALRFNNQRFLKAARSTEAECAKLRL